MKLCVDDPRGVKTFFNGWNKRKSVLVYYESSHENPNVIFKIN